MEVTYAPENCDSLVKCSVGSARGSCLVNLVCPKLLHLIFQSGIHKLTKCGTLYVQDNLSLTFLSFLDFCEIIKDKYGDKYSRQQCLSNDFPNFKRIFKNTQ